MPPRTHGQSRTVEYQTWLNIRARCYYERDVKFAYYGGRGVTVCRRWRESAEAFLSDMGPRPPGRYSIERKDNALGYFCGKCDECHKRGLVESNCAWLPSEKQNAHRSFPLTKRRVAGRLFSKGAELLLAALVSRGWSQNELERRMCHDSKSAHRGLISRWCGGLTRPNLSSALMLESELGIPVGSWTESTTAAAA